MDRAWDGKWSMNAAYTLAFNEGNAEGPVNTDTDFGDTGRTENFDDPWVNYGGFGYLPNDRRHQIKLRGAYGFGEDWRVGMTLNAQSGRPISAFGSANPFDGTNVPQLLHLHRQLRFGGRRGVRAARPRLAGPHALDLRCGRERHLAATSSDRPMCS